VSLFLPGIPIKRLKRSFQWLFVKGSSKSGNKPPAFDLATAQHVVEHQDGELPLPQRLLCRIRYFTDGVILGSQSFVDSHFDRLKQLLGYRPHRAATPLSALGSLSLWVFPRPADASKRCIVAAKIIAAMLGIGISPCSGMPFDSLDGATKVKPYV